MAIIKEGVEGNGKAGKENCEVQGGHSGYQFFSNVFQGTETECIEAGGKQETLYLNSIEGMAESIVEGGNITIDECIPEDMVDW